MMIMPINKPIALPTGPDCFKNELPVKTKEPHPIAVPIDNANAPNTDMFLFLFTVSIIL